MSCSNLTAINRRVFSVVCCPSTFFLEFQQLRSCFVVENQFLIICFFMELFSVSWTAVCNYGKVVGKSDSKCRCPVSAVLRVGVRCAGDWCGEVVVGSQSISCYTHFILRHPSLVDVACDDALTWWTRHETGASLTSAHLIVATRTATCNDDVSN